MDLAPSPAAREIIARLEAFMDEHVYPAESVYSVQLEAAGPRSHVLPPVVESLKLEARRQGMWNLFMPALSGLSHLDYAHIAEVTGTLALHCPRSPQLRGARYRKHGDPAPGGNPRAEGAMASTTARRHNAFRLLHD